MKFSEINAVKVGDYFIPWIHKTPLIKEKIIKVNGTSMPDGSYAVGSIVTIVDRNEILYLNYNAGEFLEYGARKYHWCDVAVEKGNTEDKKEQEMFRINGTNHLYSEVEILMVNKAIDVLDNHCMFKDNQYSEMKNYWAIDSFNYLTFDFIKNNCKPNETVFIIEKNSTEFGFIGWRSDGLILCELSGNGLNVCPWSEKEIQKAKWQIKGIL